MKDTTQKKSKGVSVFVLIAILAFVLLSYLPVFIRLAKIWSANQDYSHGYMVLPIAAYLLWLQKDSLATALRGTQTGLQFAIGLGLVLLSLCVRITGILGRALPAEGASLPILFLGIVVLLFGLKSAWATIGPILFLLFMLPIPSHLSRSLRNELQGVATNSSVYVLQTLGEPAVSRGNVIQLPNAEVGVVEACSGLRMLSSLGAIAFLICLLVKATWTNKALLLMSVVPIAIVVNVFRVVVTSLAQEHWPDWANQIHDLAGWLMIVLAFLLLFGLIKYLSLLFVAESSTQATTTTISG